MDKKNYDPTQTTVVVKKDPSGSPTKPFKFMGVEFPFYFKNPRWVHNNQGAVTIAFDMTDWTEAQRAKFPTVYQPELTKLVIKVLEKQLKIKIASA